MKHHSTTLMLSLGLLAFTVGAQTLDLGPDASSYRRFLLYPHLEKGFKAMARGDRNRALAEFEQARQLAPNNPMVAMHLAEAYRRFGEPARADAVLAEFRVRTANPVLRPVVPVVSPIPAVPAVPLALILAESMKKPEVERSGARVTPLAKGKLQRVAGRARGRAVVARVTPPAPKGESAYAFADEAYQASARGEHAVAALAARQALRLAPDNRAYRSLLVHELTQIQQFDEADAVASQAVTGPDVPGLEDELVMRQKLVRQYIAFKHFEAANSAAAAGQTEEATDAARKAIAYAPDLLPYRLQLVGLLLNAQQWPAAEQAASEAIQAQGPEPMLLMLRTHALQHHQAAPAVLAGQALPKVVCEGYSFTPVCDVRLALPLHDPAYALADEAYKAFDTHNHELAVSKAREALQLAPGNPQFRLLLVQALMAAGQLAQTEQEASDFLAAAGDDGDMLALRSQVRQRMGYRLLAAADAQAALDSNTLSVAREIDLLLQLQRPQQARERFATALRDGALAKLLDVDVAYLAVRVGDDEAALAAFDRAASHQALPDTALQDAAYVAARLGRNEVSVAYFKQALDAAEAGQLALTPQQRFNARRSVADQTRKGGVYGSITYRGIATSGLSLTPGATHDTVQSGLEAYWRPLGYGDGRLLELYGGLSGTLYSDVGLSTGAPSVQGALGVRVKPLSAANLVLAVERRLKVGSLTQDDWLARVGYSWDQGLDLRVDQPDWLTAQFYAETGRFIELKQNYATFEGQLGRSFRLDPAHPRMVVFPHLVLGGDRNTGYQTGQANAVGAGVGASVRYWFNEDKYTAPRSYWDASLQYRGHLGGDERAKGVFFRLALSY